MHIGEKERRIGNVVSKNFSRRRKVSNYLSYGSVIRAHIIGNSRPRLAKTRFKRFLAPSETMWAKERIVKRKFTSGRSPVDCIDEQWPMKITSFTYRVLRNARLVITSQMTVVSCQCFLANAIFGDGTADGTHLITLSIRISFNGRRSSTIERKIWYTRPR